ncbi:MAG TPA: MlaD family protein, partial [Coriobacteriia bacterium]
MTTARALTLGALVVAVALVAILLLGSSGAHQYKLVFQTAGQLVNDNDVQVGGRRVGSVKDIQLTANNQAEITIEVDKP